MANDDFNNAQTDKEVLRRLQGEPTARPGPDDILGILGLTTPTVRTCWPWIQDQIARDAEKRGLTDCDAYVIWRLGIAAYTEARNLSAVFPCDSTPPPRAELPRPTQPPPGPPPPPPPAPPPKRAPLTYPPPPHPQPEKSSRG